MCTQNAFDVAERALALTLAFYGRVIEFHEDLKNEIWHGFWVNKGSEDNWDSLYGKTCSVLGVGAIGQELAKLLKAFHCVVYGYRRTQNASIPEGFDAILPTIDQAIDSSEIIFITFQQLSRLRISSQKRCCTVCRANFSSTWVGGA